MSKKGKAKTTPKVNPNRDLMDVEINKVFEDLHLPDGRRGLLVAQGAELAGPALYFPLTVSTPTEPPIDW